MKIHHTKYKQLYEAYILQFIEDEDGNRVDVDVVEKLFDQIAPRFEERPGGYTRLVKTGKRPGDNADMAMVMLLEDE